MSNKRKAIVISAEVLAFALAITIVTISIKTHSKRYFEVTAQSSLTRVLEINELHTLVRSFWSTPLNFMQTSYSCAFPRTTLMN